MSVWLVVGEERERKCRVEVEQRVGQKHEVINFIIELKAMLSGRERCWLHLANDQRLSMHYREMGTHSCCCVLVS